METDETNGKVKKPAGENTLIYHNTRRNLSRSCKIRGTRGAHREQPSQATPPTTHEKRGSYHHAAKLSPRLVKSKLKRRPLQSNSGPTTIRLVKILRARQRRHA